jgi:hypothetical protein
MYEDFFDKGLEAYKKESVGIARSPYNACTLEYFFWKAGWMSGLEHDLQIGHHPAQLGCIAADE